MDIKQLPWQEILELADLLLEKGLDEDEVVSEISEMLDQLIDFSVIIPNPAVGMALEAADGLIFATAIRIAVNMAKRDPEARKARRQKRVKMVRKLPKNLKKLINK